tara:strand:+ start:19724 stop:19897 length:174 start_codon:yes stop_codon:yes gene_type:complete
MTNLDTNPTKKLKAGDKVKYTRNFAFGKTGIEITRVIMVNKHKILLENGQTLYKVNF